MPPPLISGYSIPRERPSENGQTQLPVQKPGAKAKLSNFWINGRKCLKFDVLNGILTDEYAYACGITGGQAYEFTTPNMGMEAPPHQYRRAVFRYAYAGSVGRTVRSGAGRGLRARRTRALSAVLPGALCGCLLAGDPGAFLGCVLAYILARILIRLRRRAAKPSRR